MIECQNAPDDMLHLADAARLERDNAQKSDSLRYMCLVMPLLPCSEDQVRVMSDISNSELRDALRQPRPEWSKVRWVNVQVR
jgi:hypothetical protein